MILTRSPFRATLGGGGTDLPSYYERHGGFVFSMALDRYMYVAINPPGMDTKIRVHYTKSETVDHPDQLQHELVREALLRLNILEKMEISSMADLRAGMGLGSSSCYLVALLKSLRAFKREPVGLQELAEEACDIEINRLKKPIGKQDQYMATYGGVTVLNIAKDGSVAVRSAKINNATLIDFIANTHLYYTGIRGSVPEILRDQDTAMRQDTAPSHDVVQGSLHGIKELGYATLEAIESENYDEFGSLMDKHWQFKKRMSSRISIPGIDELYSEIKKRFGVLGSKVSGAGGGGFFMVYAPKHHAELDEFMVRHGLTRMHYGVDWEGAKILVQ